MSALWHSAWWWSVRWGLGALVVVPGLALASGQPGSLDLNFAPSVLMDGAITAAAAQPDGKTVVVGPFISIDGVARSSVARLNADGSVDTTFSANIDASRLSLTANLINKNGIERTIAPLVAIQPDGKVVVVTRSYVTGPYEFTLMRFATNGVLEIRAAIQLGPDPLGPPLISAMVPQADGKVVIGGDFVSVNSLERRHIARLNSDGTVDTAFAPSSAYGWAGVTSLAVQPNGRILAGGDIFEPSSFLADTPAVVRLNEDGSEDRSFWPFDFSQLNISGPVNALALQADQKILVGFVGQGATSTTASLLRLNGDGSLDLAFNGLLGLQPNYEISAIAVDAGEKEKIWIGGYFGFFTDSFHSGLARLNADGTVDPTWPPVPVGSGRVYGIQSMAGGRVLVTGVFYEAGGLSARGLAVFNPDGSVDQNIDPRVMMPGYLRSVFPLSNGTIFLGGQFTEVNGIARADLARLKADGSLDASFDADAVTADYWFTELLAVQPDGKPLIATEQFFGTYRFLRLNLDGSVDSTFNGPILDTLPQSTVIQPDGKMILAGYDTGVTGLARLNSDGSLDLGFEPPPGLLTNNLYEGSLAVQSDGHILYVLQFPTNSVLGRLNGDGSEDSSFQAASALGRIYWFSVQLDNKVLVGGYSWATDGFYLWRLAPDGSFDTGFSAGMISGPNFLPLTAAVQADGKIIIGGNDGITPAAALVRLNSDGSLDPSFDPGSGPNAQVREVALQADGQILIRGDFDACDGVTRRMLARVAGGDATAFPPTIFRQSTNLTVNVGDLVNLNVLARGFPLSYQWSFNGNPLPGAIGSSLSLFQVGLAQSGSYTLLVSNSLGTAASQPILLRVRPNLPLAEALDTDLDFYAVPGSWLAETNITHDATDAIESAPLGNNQQAALDAVLPGPGMLTFWWKVSSEPGYDFMQFLVDGAVQASISGEVDWQQGTFVFTNSHTVSWRYVKDGSLSGGQDRGWLDQVSFTGRPPQPFYLAVQPVPGGLFLLTLAGEPGRRYRIETSTNFVDWTYWTEVVLFGETTQLGDALSGDTPQRFYRAWAR